MLKFGSIQLDMPFIQAPLSGYTDYPMRILARRHGCPLTFTGVMLDKIALHHKALKKAEFQPQPDEHPVGAQVLGDDPEIMSQAAVKFLDIGYDLIDLNFLMDQLGHMDISSVLIEGGSRVIASAFSSGIVDKVNIFFAPKILGGDDGVPVCAGPGPDLISDCIQLNDIQTFRFENDIMIEGYVR